MNSQKVIKFIIRSPNFCNIKPNSRKQRKFKNVCTFVRTLLMRFASEREYAAYYKTPCTYRMFRVKSYKIDGPDGDPLSPLTFHSRL